MKDDYCNIHTTRDWLHTYTVSSALHYCTILHLFLSSFCSFNLEIWSINVLFVTMLGGARKSWCCWLICLPREKLTCLAVQASDESFCFLQFNHLLNYCISCDLWPIPIIRLFIAKKAGVWGCCCVVMLFFLWFDFRHQLHIIICHFHST